MIHYDKILNMAVQIIEELWKEERKAVAYVIQNVYGKLQVYVDVDDEKLLSRMKGLLVESVGCWLGNCGSLQSNGFVKAEIESYVESHCADKDRIWIIEKYLTNVYWNENAVNNEKMNLHSKLTSCSACRRAGRMAIHAVKVEDFHSKPSCPRCLAPP